MQRLMLYSALEPKADNESIRDRGTWKPPRVEHFQAVEQAGSMVDRFNRLFMRTLHQLRDLRRYMPTIVVQNAGQVNVAESQVNVGASGQGTTQRPG